MNTWKHDSVLLLWTLMFPLPSVTWKKLMVKFFLVTNSSEDRIGKYLAQTRQWVSDANGSKRYCQFPRKWIKYLLTGCSVWKTLFPFISSQRLHLSAFFYLCDWLDLHLIITWQLKLSFFSCYLHQPEQPFILTERTWICSWVHTLFWTGLAFC